MMTTKNFVLVALLVLGAALSGSTPARAQTSGSFPLYCTVGVADPDFGASGQYTVKVGKFQNAAVDDWGDMWSYYKCDVSVVCWDLTPGATYSCLGTTFKAAADGSGGVRVKTILCYVYSAYSGEGSWDVKVYRDGTSTIVLASPLPIMWGY